MMLNFSHFPSLPPPITTIVLSSSQPTIPFGACPPGTPGINKSACFEPTSESALESSLTSKCAEANEYVSENALGKKGIFPRNPHFCDWTPSLALVSGSTGFEFAIEGRSKICSVDLSDVAATWWLLGEILMEKIVAVSTPRRNSAILALLAIENTRTKVPCELSAQ